MTSRFLSLSFVWMVVSINQLGKTGEDQVLRDISKQVLYIT